MLLKSSHCALFCFYGPAIVHTELEKNVSSSDLALQASFISGITAKNTVGS